MQIKTISFLFLCSLFLLSCSKETTDQPAQVPHHENSQLEVWVRIQSDTGWADAAGALVHLYETDTERLEKYRPTTGKTGDDGKYTFVSLSKNQYWITVEYDGEVQWIYDDAPFDTPGHPVLLNKLEVRYD
jgi:hypothetical protein